MWDNWGILFQASPLDLAECIIPNAKKEADIYVGLNGHKYLMQPFEHAKEIHKHKNPTPAPGML